MYDVFVAEFFLTQTPADNVGRVYPAFLDRFPALESIRRADEETLVEAITPLGFQNIRATALKTIASEHAALPSDPEELRELPRVGQYVANATVCFALDEALPILDRNVDRVYGRVFSDEWPNTPADQEAIVREILPEDDAREYNLALLDFGAAVCTPEPRCEECFATDYCTYYNETVARS